MPTQLSTFRDGEFVHALAPGRDATGLDMFFKPRSVAVVGGTESVGHIGRAIVSNLLETPFGGSICAVNPRRTSVFCLQSYPSLAAVPIPIDLAIIATPADTVPAVIKDCADAGVGGAIVISAGFREAGAHGMELESQIVSASRGRVRILGPNCLGVMSPVTGLNATFASGIASRGTVAVISQSGAVCTALLDWSKTEGIGFSALLSTGSMIDIGWGALIDHFAHDPNTQSIVLYMESVGDARSFLSAARAAALSKPILIIKAGRTDLASKAAISHTGSMVGDDAVLDAAFRRVGILRMRSLPEVFQIIEVLARQPLPCGPRLTVLTNAGGPAILATDALIESGGQLATLSDGTLQALDRYLPSHWSHGNPIDLVGDAGPERYSKALEIAQRDPESDGLLVICTPQAVTDPTAVAKVLADSPHRGDKPILASWMGGEAAEKGRAVLNTAGIPNFAFPDDAARTFSDLWRYKSNLSSLYETPRLVDQDPQSTATAAAFLDTIRQSGRHLLTETESKQVLAMYGIGVVETVLASTEETAINAAEKLGFPVVLKLNSYTITHKTDVSGVKLSLPDANAVRSAFREIRGSVADRQGPEHFLGVTVQRMITNAGYELLLGSTVDSQFGPVIVFGSGGKYVEVLQDRAIGLPPLNTTLARTLIERTRASKAITSVRDGRAVPMSELERILVRFSQLVLEQSCIREIDVNPFVESDGKLLALDARIVIYGAVGATPQRVKPAIRPYPSQYCDEMRLEDGTVLRIRPISPEDEPLIVQFHRKLSEETVYLRYLETIDLESRTRHERLRRICFIDYDREMALVAETTNRGMDREIVAVGRVTKGPRDSEAELAFVVSDAFQGRGIGSELMKRLIAFSRDEGLTSVYASTLPENQMMLRLLTEHGFTLSDTVSDGVISSRLQLSRVI